MVGEASEKHICLSFCLLLIKRVAQEVLSYRVVEILKQAQDFDDFFFNKCNELDSLRSQKKNCRGIFHHDRRSNSVREEQQIQYSMQQHTAEC